MKGVGEKGDTTLTLDLAALGSLTVKHMGFGVCRHGFKS